MEIFFQPGGGFKLKIGPFGFLTFLAVLDLVFGEGQVVRAPVDVIGTVVMAAFQ